MHDVIDLKAGEDVAATAPPVAGGAAIPADEMARITADVVKGLKTVYDPEIPVDIYELGLIYKVDINDDRHVDIEMTLTAPACPVAGRSRRNNASCSGRRSTAAARASSSTSGSANIAAGTR